MNTTLQSDDDDDDDEMSAYDENDYGSQQKRLIFGEAGENAYIRCY